MAFCQTYGHHDTYCIDHGKSIIDVYKFDHTLRQHPYEIL